MIITNNGASQDSSMLELMLSYVTHTFSGGGDDEGDSRRGRLELMSSSSSSFFHINIIDVNIRLTHYIIVSSVPPADVSRISSGPPYPLPDRSYPRIAWCRAVRCRHQPR
ncbi:hypothetical protein Tco_0452157 [Tanacetum coccineum]